MKLQDCIADAYKHKAHYQTYRVAGTACYISIAGADNPSTSGILGGLSIQAKYTFEGWENALFVKDNMESVAK